MLRAEQISKTFGRVTAVDHATFSIGEGEVVAFLGPNGAGKTTTMRLLTGFLLPDTGDVKVDGSSIADHTTEVQRLIGYMPENNPLYRDLLVREMLEFAARVNGVQRSNVASATDFVVESTGIAEVYSRPIRELSKGYRQRVGLACALIHRPKLLILDEPTEGLDPNQRNDLRSLIAKLRHDHTIMISTHVLAEATAVATRLLIINRGKLVADGSTDELMRRSSGQQMVAIDVEGDGVEEALRALDGVADLTGTQEGARFRGTVSVNADVALQPHLSRLVRERGWTVWSLTPQEHSLEEVFRSLTQEAS